MKIRLTVEYKHTETERFKDIFKAIDNASADVFENVIQDYLEEVTGTLGDLFAGIGSPPDRNRLLQVDTELLGQDNNWYRITRVTTA